MGVMKKLGHGKCRGQIFWSVPLCIVVLLCGFPALAQAQQAAPASPGSITGTVLDQKGAAIAGAHVKLTRGDTSAAQEVVTGTDGQFSFAGVAPGPFHIEISAAGFTTQTSSGELHAGESYVAPPVQLAIAAYNDKMLVTPESLAEAQVKEEEKQRVLGFVPNFYVTYEQDAVPLYPKQKFELALHYMIDPITFGLVGATAGLEQLDGQYNGFGTGAEGYGKRYGAAYADTATSTLIGSAILPSVWKQDPRYFYKGTGSSGSRLRYAISRAVICKGDDGRWQLNYSYIVGDLASGGISNLYYPKNDRGAGLVFENAAIGVAASAAENILQEFVVRKLTPGLSHNNDPVRQ